MDTQLATSSLQEQHNDFAWINALDQQLFLSVHQRKQSKKSHEE